MNTERIVQNIVEDAMAGRIAARGQQTRRKDKDLMQDTGGVSKGRDNEPDFKPPRNDIKERHRDRRKTPDQKDNDTNEDNRDRPVKKPSRRPQERKASGTTFRAHISKMYFPKEMWPDKVGNDAMYSWKIRGEKGKRADVAMALWRKHGSQILKEVNPWVKKISLHVSGGTGMGSVEDASRLSPVQVHPVLKASVHPLDRTEKSLIPGMDVPEQNFHRRVFGALWCIIERENRISEKDYSGQDWIKAECDWVVRSPEAEEIIQRFSDRRPEYCAECIFDQVLGVK